MPAAFRKAPHAQPIYKQLLKVGWVYIGPFFVMGAWFIAGFTPEKVYPLIFPLPFPPLFLPGLVVRFRDSFLKYVNKTSIPNKISGIAQILA